MITGIYGIFNSLNNECLYIGQSKDIKSRWSKHLSNLRNDKALPSFQDWFISDLNSDYEKLDFKILETCDNCTETKNALEIIWFEKLSPKFYGVKPTMSVSYVLTAARKNNISSGVKRFYQNKIKELDIDFSLINKYAKDKNKTINDLAEALNLSRTVTRSLLKTFEIKWVKGVVKVDGKTLDDYPILSWYFNDKFSTWEIADKTGFSQPSVLHYLKKFKNCDPRFNQVVKGKPLRKREKSPETIKKIQTSIKSKKVQCDNCKKYFGITTIKQHFRSCKDWPKCLVCFKILSKRSAKYCQIHKYINLN